jgi:hypothetical protein
MRDFKTIKFLFNRLFLALDDVFSGSEIAEVREFFDVGEYGLALETVIDIFAEEKKVVPGDVIAPVDALVFAMELPAAEYSARLRAPRLA